MTVGYMQVRNLLPEELASLSSDERMREFGMSTRERQFRCGRALLRGLLEELTGRPATDHELTTTERGKPVCVDGPAVSISHAGDAVVCAVAEEGDIGIDLEFGGGKRDTEAIARNFFSGWEADWLETQPADHFYMLWVLKEAWVKAGGGSIFGDANRLRCRIDPPRIDCQVDGPVPKAIGLYSVGGGFVGVATTEAMLDEVSVRSLGANAEFSLIAKGQDTEQPA